MFQPGKTADINRRCGRVARPTTLLFLLLLNTTITSSPLSHSHNALPPTTTKSGGQIGGYTLKAAKKRLPKHMPLVWDGVSQPANIKKQDAPWIGRRTHVAIVKREALFKLSKISLLCGSVGDILHAQTSGTCTSFLEIRCMSANSITTRLQNNLCWFVRYFTLEMSAKVSGSKNYFFVMACIRLITASLWRSMMSL